MGLIHKTEDECKALHIGVVSGSFLDKCLKAIKEGKGGDILIDYYDTHHVLRLNAKTMKDYIVCTTKQAKRLMPFADENELVPTRGYRWHFSNYR
jgi:hypothetical protein